MFKCEPIYSSTVHTVYAEVNHSPCLQTARRRAGAPLPMQMTPY